MGVSLATPDESVKAAQVVETESPAMGSNALLSSRGDSSASKRLWLAAGCALIVMCGIIFLTEWRVRQQSEKPSPTLDAAADNGVDSHLYDSVGNGRVRGD